MGYPGPLDGLPRAAVPGEGDLIVVTVNYRLVRRIICAAHCWARFARLAPLACLICCPAI
jgi:hypothetical protein